MSRLVLPWPARRNPHHLEHERSARATAVESGLVSGDPADPDMRRFDAFVVTDSHVYPNTPLPRLRVAGLFNQWLYFLDDQYDDHPQLGDDAGAVRALMQRSLSVLTSGRLPADPTPFDRLSQRVFEQLVAGADAYWRSRFLGDVADYLFRGSLAALEARSHGLALSVAEYFDLRVMDSGVLPVLDVVEYAIGTAFPPSVAQHDAVLELRLRAARHIAFVNDLFSYAKERVAHGEPFNLLHILTKSEALPFEAAVERAVRMINAEMEGFVDAESRLPQPGGALDSALTAYVDGLKGWVRGNVEFSLASPRFRTADAPFQELRSID